MQTSEKNKKIMKNYAWKTKKYKKILKILKKYQRNIKNNKKREVKI